MNNTKLKGDIAEQAIVLSSLKNGWEVLRPIGDRMPYDLVLDVNSVLVKIQVKAAWYDSSRDNYVVDNRRTKTNRKQMLRSRYTTDDFDFAIIYIDELQVCYIIPVDIFIDYGSEIHLVEATKRQRKPRSFEFREAWHLISNWAASEEIPK